MNRSRRIWGIAGMMAVLLFAGLLVTSAWLGADAYAETPPAELRGIAFFRGELMETGYVFSPDATNSCEAIATLVNEEADEYELRLSELCEGEEPRLSIWKLSLPVDGQVSGTFFERQVYPVSEASTFDEIWTHTGCTMAGGFPELTGTWDGERLLAYTVFEGRCEGGTYWGDPEIMMWISQDDAPDGPMADGLDWSDGRAHMEFGVDLTVVP